MPRRRRDPRWAQKLVVAAARLVAWLTDLAAILVLAYIIKCWPSSGGAVSAGIVGSVIALLNDSWEMIANADPTRNFIPLTAPRAVLHDLFSMGICMGGLILLLFSDIREKRAREGGDDFADDWGQKRTLFGVAQWFLAAIA
jgi:hypothetical protein